MITPKTNTYKLTVYLKSGHKFQAVETGERTFQATSFTKKSLHKFIHGNTSYLVQGDNIAYIESSD